jgi:hypothetical protein
LGWVLGQIILKAFRPKNVSAQTLQEMIGIKNWKGHMPTDIYLIGLGVGSGFSETTQAQKCFSPNPSGNDSYRKSSGSYANQHLSYWVGGWARFF